MVDEVDSPWLPSDFISDDLFFMEAEERRKPEATPGASADKSSLFSGYQRTLASGSPDYTTAEDEAEDHLARLTLRMAQSFLLDDEDDAESTLYAWPSSTEPNQLLQLAVHSDAKGQVMRRRPNNLKSHGDLCSGGHLGHHRKAFPPLPAPYSYGRTCSVPPSVQQLRAAQFHHLKQLYLMKLQKGTTSGGGGGLPLGMSPSAWPPLQRQHQLQRPKIGSWHGARAVLLKSSAGTGVFIPRTAGSEAQPPPPPRRKRDAAVLAGGSNEVLEQKQRNLLPHLPSMISHEMQLPHERTY